MPLDIFIFNCMYVNHFQRNVINCVSIYLPKLDNIIHKVMKNKKYPVNSDKWKIATPVPLKHIIPSNQNCLPIQQMSNKLVTDISIKKKTNQFKVKFMFRPVYKQYKTH